MLLERAHYESEKLLPLLAALPLLPRLCEDLRQPTHARRVVQVATTPSVLRELP